MNHTTKPKGRIEIIVQERTVVNLPTPHETRDLHSPLETMKKGKNELTDDDPENMIGTIMIENEIIKNNQKIMKDLVDPIDIGKPDDHLTDNRRGTVNATETIAILMTNLNPNTTEITQLPKKVIEIRPNINKPIIPTEHVI